MKYLLVHKKNFIDDMIKHLNRKSISDCLLKLLLSYSPEVADTEIKTEIINKILDNIDFNDEEVRYI